MIQISLTDFSLLCLPVCRPHEARKVFDLRQKACIAAAKALPLLCSACERHRARGATERQPRLMEAKLLQRGHLQHP